MSPRAAKPNPVQEELALSSVAAHRLFATRSTIYVHEVARALSISEQQVIDLIVSGDLVAINISANRGAGQPSAEMTPEARRRVSRTHWRVPVSAYDAFLGRRKSA